MVVTIQSERERSRGRSYKKCPSFLLVISIMPLDFDINYKTTPSVVFVLVFLCSIIISLVFLPVEMLS